MPIVDRTSTFTRHRARFRYRYKYTFNDGRIVEKGPCTVNTQAEGDALMPTLEPGVLLNEQGRDAEDAERNDRGIVARGEAQPRQIARQYLHRAMVEDDPLVALNKFKQAEAFFSRKGWNPPQIRSQMGLTTEQWSKMTTRSAFLRSHEATLVAYRNILADDTVRED